MMALALCESVVSISVVLQCLSSLPRFSDAAPDCPTRTPPIVIVSDVSTSKHAFVKKKMDLNLTASVVLWPSGTLSRVRGSNAVTAGRTLARCQRGASSLRIGAATARTVPSAPPSRPTVPSPSLPRRKKTWSWTLSTLRGRHSSLPTRSSPGLWPRRGFLKSLKSKAYFPCQEILRSWFLALVPFFHFHIQERPSFLGGCFACSW